MTTPSSQIQPHDRGHRLLFSHPRIIEDLLQGFVKEPWVQALDWRSLERLPADFVSGRLAGEFEARLGDILWRVDWKKGGESSSLLLLLEFQSTCDQAMALRLLVYAALLHQRWIREHPLKRSNRLPHVFPLVLYNGRRKWNAPQSLTGLFGPIHKALEGYQPSITYHLIDEKRCSLEGLEEQENITSAIFKACRDCGPLDLRRIVWQLRDWLSTPEDQALRRDLAAWLSKVVLPRRLPGIEFPEIQDLDDFYTVMEDQMQTWTEKWFQDGYQLGQKKGYAESMLRLLEQKFGPLETPMRSRIEQAEPDQILTWFDRVLTARRLEEVFAG